MSDLPTTIYTFHQQNSNTTLPNETTYLLSSQQQCVRFSTSTFRQDEQAQHNNNNYDSLSNSLELEDHLAMQELQAHEQATHYLDEPMNGSNNNTNNTIVHANNTNNIANTTSTSILDLPSTLEQLRLLKRYKIQVLVAIYLFSLLSIILLTMHDLLRFKQWSYVLVFTPLTIAMYLSFYYLIAYQVEIEHFFTTTISKGKFRILLITCLILFVSSFLMIVMNIASKPSYKDKRVVWPVNWYIAIAPMCTCIAVCMIALPMSMFVQYIWQLRYKLTGQPHKQSTVHGTRAARWYEYEPNQVLEEFYTRMWQYSLVITIGVCLCSTLFCFALYEQSSYGKKHKSSSPATDMILHISWCLLPMYIAEAYALGIAVISKLSKDLCSFFIPIIEDSSNQTNWLVAILLIAPSCVFAQAVIGLYSMFGSIVFLSLLIPMTFATCFAYIILQTTGNEEEGFVELTNATVQEAIAA